MTSRITLTWDVALWKQMTRHAFLGTTAGRRGIVLGIALAATGIPLGLVLMTWATDAWGLRGVGGMQLVVFLSGFLTMVIAGIGVIAGTWSSRNAHIGRIEQQGAYVDQGELVFTFKLRGRGLPDARHIIVVRLDRATTRMEYDHDLRCATFSRVGNAEAIWHGYTRHFSTTGATSEYDMQLLVDYTIPDDFEPSLLQVIAPYFD